MPKASPASSSSGARSNSGPFQNAQVLRRNQACHQCRRRKLKCDAKRPTCSTCTRSHAYAVAHASGTDHPLHPECTFDDIPEPVPATVADSQEPKTRFESLEKRIAELEAELREKDEALSLAKPSPSDSGTSDATLYDSSVLFLGLNDNYFGLGDESMSMYMGTMPSGSPLDDLAGAAALRAPMDLHLNANIYSSMPVPDPSWPNGLPDASIVRHLVQAYFAFTPLAGRMFHAPTFLASLSLPPTHPKFPLPAILHAMCAMGSMYTAAIAPNSGDPSIIDNLEDSFAENQIWAAKNAIATSLRNTSDLFESLQAQIIIALWYWYNARWSEACISFAISLRYAVPCGLNVCPPFESLATSNMARASIIPPAANVYEDEMRRNTFWIAYMTERHFTAINSFTTFLDDQDIAQMLPVRGDQFEHGTLVTPEERQWCHHSDVIETHPEEQVDSFFLHVKATMVLSRVKTFNCRYKIRHAIGDPATIPDLKGLGNYPYADTILATPAFKELEKFVSAFIDSFPPHLRDPTANGVIDASLLTALSTAHLAAIILHESHAAIGHSACRASCAILKAARAILDLLYAAYATGHSLATLGVFPMVCWFAAGRVLVKFLRSAIEAKSDEHINALRTEVDFIRSVIHNIGDHMPHAYHYGRMLDEYAAHTCGKEYAKPVASLNVLGKAEAPFVEASSILDQPIHLDFDFDTSGFSGVEVAV